MIVPHLLGIAAATVFVIFCTLLPFLPGSYDSLAVPLSEMAHAVGTLGLLLVPVGLLWIAAQRSSRLVQRRHAFPLLALIASTLVWLGVCLAAILHSSFVLGFTVLLLWGFLAVKAWAVFRSRSAKETGLPFYLIAVPVLVALVQFVFV